VTRGRKKPISGAPREKKVEACHVEALWGERAQAVNWEGRLEYRGKKREEQRHLPKLPHWRNILLEASQLAGGGVSGRKGTDGVRAFRTALP